MLSALILAGLMVTVMNPDGIDTKAGTDGKTLHYAFGTQCTLTAWRYVLPVDVGPEDTLYRFVPPDTVVLGTGDCPSGTLLLSHPQPVQRERFADQRRVTRGQPAPAPTEVETAPAPPPNRDEQLRSKVSARLANPTL